MSARAKIALVIAGYVGAFLVASVVVAVYVASTAGPDRQNSSGMFAFGDSLLFLAVFGLSSVPATALGLFFLRPHAWFWRFLVIVAGLVAATGVAALAVILMARQAGPRSELQPWAAFSVLRILVAPLAALAFFVSGAFAPRLPARVALGAAMLIEVAVFAFWLIRLP